MSEGLSSTGGLGRNPRPDNRVYENGDLYYMRPGELAEHFVGLLEDSHNPPDTTRWVLRGIVNDETMDAIQAGSYNLRDNLEVALPLRQLGRPGWLMYLGHNAEERRISSGRTAEIIAATAGQSARTEYPINVVRNVIRQGFEIRSTPSEDDVEALAGLWVPGFVWDQQGVQGFVQGIRAQHEQRHGAQNQFFIGAYRDNLLVGAAMGERIDLPLDRNPLPLVESTEWYVSEEYRGRGLMTGLLTALHTQILRNAQINREQTLIYAECSFTSRSDRAGHGAGMRIPSRHFANQIIPQNVTVGGTGESAGLCDFNFMYLPSSGYGPRQTDMINNVIRSTE
jgi:hypothetical protein